MHRILYQVLNMESGIDWSHSTHHWYRTLNGDDFRFDGYELFYDDKDIYNMVKFMEQLTRNPLLHLIKYTPLDNRYQIKQYELVPTAQNEQILFLTDYNYTRNMMGESKLNTTIEINKVDEICRKLVADYHSKFKGEFWECYDRAYIR